MFINELIPPFDTFRLEKQAGEYKDFGASADNSYPLRGVTYPVDYDDISGYIGEDNAHLDVFLGRQGQINGYIKVYRPELSDGEHKFFINLTEDEEAAVLKEFGPVILASGRFDTVDDLLAAIKPFEKQA